MQRPRSPTPEPPSPSPRIHSEGSSGLWCSFPAPGADSTPMSASHQITTDEILHRLEEACLRLVEELSPVDQPQEGTIISTQRLLRLFRLAVLLPVVYQLKRDAQVAVQRDVFYRLEKYFLDQREANAAIELLCREVNLTRSMLNLEAGGRGAIGGSITLGGIDLSTIGSHGYAISGAVADIWSEGSAERNGFAPTIDCTHAKYLLIVEKDAVFVRLMEERLFDAVPVILITSQGFPTVAVKALVRYILQRYPDVVPLGLVDYNPAGIHILLQYAPCCGGAVGDDEVRLKWLGTRRSQLTHLATHNFPRLSKREVVMGRNLLIDRKGCRRVPSQWCGEICAMLEGGWKTDIEALYVVDPNESTAKASFGSLVTSWILRKEYL